MEQWGTVLVFLGWRQIGAWVTDSTIRYLVVALRSVEHGVPRLFSVIAVFPPQHCLANWAQVVEALNALVRSEMVHTGDVGMLVVAQMVRGG